MYKSSRITLIFRDSEFNIRQIRGIHILCDKFAILLHRT